MLTAMLECSRTVSAWALTKLAFHQVSNRSSELGRGRSSVPKYLPFSVTRSLSIVKHVGCDRAMLLVGYAFGRSVDRASSRLEYVVC